MLKDFNEQDFLNLKEIAGDRLLPSKISIGLLGVLFFSGAINAVLYFAVSYSSYINHPIWNFIVPICIGLFIIQAIITIFFFNDERAFAYQNFQSVFLCFVMFKLSVEGYIVFFAVYEDRFSPPYFAELAITFLVGGLIFFIYSIFRAIKRVKNGHFQKGQKGLLNFSESKSYVGLPIIFATVMTAGAFTRMLSNSTHPFASMLELYFILFLIAIFQFGIAFVWPEFWLLAYCKHKYKSFKMISPKGVNIR